MRRLSNVRVRNVATIGGNLAHGDPHMDLPPVLMALERQHRWSPAAAASARSRSRTCSPAITRPCSSRDELIAELRIPAQGTRRAAYLKVHHRLRRRLAGARRRGLARSRRQGRSRDAARGRERRDREGDPPQGAPKQVLSGATIDDAVLARAGDAAADEAETVSDVRGSAPYKRELLRVYVRRAVRQALDGTRQGASH